MRCLEIQRCMSNMKAPCGVISDAGVPAVLFRSWDPEKKKNVHFFTRRKYWRYDENTYEDKKKTKKDDEKDEKSPHSPRNARSRVVVLIVQNSISYTCTIFPVVFLSTAAAAVPYVQTLHSYISRVSARGVWYCLGTHPFSPQAPSVLSILQGACRYSYVERVGALFPSKLHGTR